VRKQIKPKTALYKIKDPSYNVYLVQSFDSLSALESIVSKRYRTVNNIFRVTSEFGKIPEIYNVFFDDRYYTEYEVSLVR